MLLEVCSNSNMFDHLAKRKTLTVPEIQYYIRQLIEALDYLHKKMIIHRDVKLGNLFINQKMELRLGDFGLAGKLEFDGERKRTVCGTPNYVAPQIIQNSKGYSYEIDIWSVGVILFYMLIGKPPFQAEKVELTYKRILKADFTIPHSFKNTLAIDLLNKILVVDPAKRFTAQEILSHPFMNPSTGAILQLPSKCMIEAPNLFQIKRETSIQKQKSSARNLLMSREKAFPKSSTLIQKINEQSTKQEETPVNLRLNKSPRNLPGIQCDLLKNGSFAQFKRYQEQKLMAKSQSMKYIPIRHLSPQPKIQPPKPKQIYIFDYKINQGIVQYSLNNGIVGIYQSNKKYIYDSQSKKYYKTLNKKISPLDSQFLFTIQFQPIKQTLLNLPPHPFISSLSPVFITRILKTQEIIIFYLSNGTIQGDFVKSQHQIVISKQNLILRKKGKEKQIAKENKESYLESKNSTLIKCYKIVLEVVEKSKD